MTRTIKNEMKAMLLAAGEGIRLRPLINTVPKCMVPIFGKPTLAWTVTWLAGFGYRFSPQERLWLIDIPSKLESVMSDPTFEAAFQ